LNFTDDALKAISEKAIERKTGARGLRSIVETMLLDSMYEVPDLEGVSEVNVTANTVNKNEKPEYIMGEKKKKASKDKDAAKGTELTAAS